MEIWLCDSFVFNENYVAKSKHRQLICFLSTLKLIQLALHSITILNITSSMGNNQSLFSCDLTK